jgi:hypothetical protein
VLFCFRRPDSRAYAFIACSLTAVLCRQHEDECLTQKVLLETFFMPASGGEFLHARTIAWACQAMNQIFIQNSKVLCEI